MRGGGKRAGTGRFRAGAVRAARRRPLAEAGSAGAWPSSEGGAEPGTEPGTESEPGTEPGGASGRHRHGETPLRAADKREGHGDSGNGAVR